MAKSDKPRQQVTANDIVVVDANGRAHIQPKGNLEGVKKYNSRVPADKRSKIFNFIEGKTEVSEYLKLANPKEARQVDNTAVQKLATKNQELQTEAENLKREKDEMAATMAKLQADLKEAKQAAADALTTKAAKVEAAEEKVIATPTAKSGKTEEKDK